jgi:hypothetical protein
MSVFGQAVKEEAKRLQKANLLYWAKRRAKRINDKCKRHQRPSPAEMAELVALREEMEKHGMKREADAIGL